VQNLLMHYDKVQICSQLRHNLTRKGDEPRTLLHRLLKQVNSQVQAKLKSPTGPLNATAKSRATTEASPVRPPSPLPPSQPTEQLAPQPRSTQSIAIPQSVTGVEERLKAEEALEHIRQRTAEIANEFAEGKLNRAQFTAMYTHFNEKRVIIERLLARDPDTQAWQSVARPGHTTFLRQHFEARVTAYTIYDNGIVEPANYISSGGSTDQALSIAQPILTALNVLLKTRTTSKPLRALRRQMEDGQWIAIIPGTYTSAIAVFSLEPSNNQFERVVDIHRDFERANRMALERGVRLPDQLVFPHRALFEQQGH
jgi:hypothetical protein